jgi:hypothetical protein
VQNLILESIDDLHSDGIRTGESGFNSWSGKICFRSTASRQNLGLTQPPFPGTEENLKIPKSEIPRFQPNTLRKQVCTKLAWHHHIFTKRKQLGLTLTKMHWLLGRSSRLSLPNKLLLYKIILEPIWTYDIQLWGTASTSNIEIVECFQSKALRIIVDASWYVPNNHISRDLQMTSVKEEICRSSKQYCTRLTTHPNDQILTLMDIPGNRRLRRHVPNDLADRLLL